MKKIAVVGLGYVGLGLAVGLSKDQEVIGYDISKKRVENLVNYLDENKLFTKAQLSACKIRYTDTLNDIKDSNFFIVAVSTPANFYELPDLEPLIKATKQLATVLKKGDIIVFESTVYPGTTEEVCLPLLEEFSGLKNGRDFNIGYSPERISPGDEIHSLAKVTKIISAQNDQTLKDVRSVYELCCEKVYPVSNIKTAESVKILENTQRDINIAIMNEFAEIMHAMDVNVHEVIEAAKTKWSYVDFKPGFVGGHCISVDPLYLAFKAKRLGIDHGLILAARMVNDNVTRFVVQQLNKLMIKTHSDLSDSTVGIFGVTYKENVPDVRNSLALKLVKELHVAGFTCKVHDPLANKEMLKKRYHIDLLDFDEITHLSIAILIVAHDFYREVGVKAFIEKLKGKKILMDIPNVFCEDTQALKTIIYWSL